MKKVKTDPKAIGKANASRVFAARLDTLIFKLQSILGKVGAKMPSEIEDETLFLAGQLSGIAAALKHIEDLRNEIKREDFKVKGKS